MRACQPQIDLVQRSLSDPEAFWTEEAQLIHWETPFERACDFSRPPFAKWFTGGTTNLCYNAVDRHLGERADQNAILWVSSETDEERSLTYRELYRDVNTMATVLQSLGINRGDRVVIYMPMVPEALVAMLACVRLGAIHSAVFAGFAAESLARRISDAEARLVITCDAGLRNGKLVRLKQTADEAARLSNCNPRVLVINRGLDTGTEWNDATDVDYATAAHSIGDADVPCAWLESSEPSYLLYTSGTTAKPKGVQRDTGGYAVALMASMKHIFDARPGETYFSTADIGWVVGHSYNVYGPLLNGMTTVIFEGLPIRRDARVWWDIAHKTQASVMFSSPTAMRILKKYDVATITDHDLSGLRRLFLAGEPLDAPTSNWIQSALPHVRVIDNYWQTETGWPILSLTAACAVSSSKPGSPGLPIYGYDVYIAHEKTGAPLPKGEKGVVAIRLPLPPGCMSTVWKNDELFENHYCGQFSMTQAYSTFDYAIEDEDGYIFILGRTDDVINVAGHRIGTREIEEAVSSHPEVAEAAAVGVGHEEKGQAIHCLIVLKNAAAFPTDEDRQRVAQDVRETVAKKLGAIARPAFVGVVNQLPKTRSGKIVRRAILAIAEGRDPGDLSTLEDSAALQSVRDAEEIAARS